ncbi:MAG: DMT family transporter [Bacteroidales bacterium]|nr:DMT family transporter [Bacteroidales bacterium]
MKPSRALMYGGITLAMIFWALSFIGYKLAYRYFGPMALIFFRLVIASLFLFLLIRLLRLNEPIRRADWGRFLLLSLFEPLLYFLGESYGMTMVSSTTGAVIVSTIPLITPLAAWLLLGEKVSWLKVGGIIISFIGVCLVLIEPGFRVTAPVLGIGLMFLAVFSTIGYSVMIVKLTATYRPTTIILMQSLIGSFYFLPIFILTDLPETLAMSFSWGALLPLLFLGLFPSTLSFIFFTNAIREIGITRANIFTNFIPVFTAIFSFFILHESFTVTKTIGIPVVLAGLMIAQLKLRKKAI